MTSANTTEDKVPCANCNCGLGNPVPTKKRVLPLMNCKTMRKNKQK